MDNGFNPSQTVPGETLIPGGGENGSDAINLKDVLNSALGRSYNTDEEALEAVKNTYNYVGEYGKFKPHLEKLQGKLGGEDKVIKFMETQINGSDTQQVVPAPAVDTSKFISKDVYDTDTFFSKNPQMGEFRDVITALQSSTGKTLDEVVKLPSFTAIYDKAIKADEYEKSRTVLHSNPRLGIMKDKITEAKQFASSGNTEAAKASALEAVFEAYPELRQ